MFPPVVLETMVPLPISLWFEPDVFTNKPLMPKAELWILIVMLLNTLFQTEKLWVFLLVDTKLKPGLL